MTTHPDHTYPPLLAQGQTWEEMTVGTEFRTAAELEPDRSRYAYVYAVALHSSGRVDDSMKVLKDTLVRHPNDRETLLALVTFNRDSGDIGAALEYAEQLSRITPNDPDLTRLTDDLRTRLKR